MDMTAKPAAYKYQNIEDIGGSNVADMRLVASHANAAAIPSPA
jgi:hypothetical protein